MDNPFLLPVEHYQRDLGIISGYHNDSALYLSLNTGRPFKECLAFTRKFTQPDQTTGFKNPKAVVLTRDKNWDREASDMSFMSFLKQVKNEGLLLSPSMTAYLPESVRKSTHASYIEGGVKRRKKVKKEMMAAKGRGDVETALVKDGEQKNYKINNNSYSGATVSLATILYFKSTHSSLTSTCRTATSYANAANEKFLAGNRHYYNAEVTKANLLSIINTCDVDLVDRVCQHWGLHYPTTEDLIACIERSIEHYWGSPQQMVIFHRMANNMTPAQRAAFVYIGDLYHLHKHNRAFVESFLFKLSEVGGSEDAIDEATFKNYDGDTQILASFLCYDSVKGRADEELKAEAPDVLDKVYATGHRAIKTLNQYQDVIKAFFLAATVPSSIHAMPDMYRRAVPVSDTDSTMFTMQYWIEQMFGYVSFSERAKQVVFGLVFIVSEILVHILAIMSANMGVGPDKLKMLAMKNEYYFAVMSMTTRSKHYYASQDAQEGLMFAHSELEVKGVGLRDSKVPPVINRAARAMMEDLLNTIKAEKPIHLAEKLKEAADLEREITRSIMAGEAEYLTSGQIKASDSYKQGEDASAFAQYLLWEEVFSPSYGAIQPPPYSVFKASLRANNRTEVDVWCRSMGNDEMANRLKAWMHRNKRTNLTTLMIPATVLETYGIPKEILAGIDIRKIIANIMGTFYLMFESLGIFLSDKNNVRLLSDYY